MFTLVFDREAYHPSFFNWLWQTHRIAVITYRKNVEDKWAIEDFKEHEITVIQNKVTMLLCEKPVQLGGYNFREVRQLNEGDHQTSIITTHPDSLDISTIAGKMFSRWSQENFFRYLIQDFDFDRIWQYGIQALNDQIEITNPLYRQVNQTIKKKRKKKRRVQADLANQIDEIIADTIDKVPTYSLKQKTYIDKIKLMSQEEKILLEQRKHIPTKVKLSEMPHDKRYNQLKPEHKHYINMIKMIS